jgi:hypothetical protein
MKPKPGRIRASVGLACEDVAKLAGVSRPTIRVYESHPDAVGSRDPNVRARCDWAYAKLQEVLEEAHEMRLRLGSENARQK